MEQIRWERMAAFFLCLLFGGGLIYCAFRFALPLLLPFLLAWGISLGVRPLSQRISRFLHLPQKLCAVVLLAAVILLGAWGIWVGSVRLLSELAGVVERLLADGTVPRVIGAVSNWLEQLGEVFGLTGEDGSQVGRFSSMMSEMLGGLLSSVSARLPDVLGGLLSSVPTVFFIVIVTVISGFYFCVDGERIRGALVSLLPPSWKKRISPMRARMREISWRYVKAYLLLLALTFLLLFVGFLILGIDYAFLLALLIAVADLLPVIGVGTVMVPWSVILLLQRQFYLGFGLLILYLAIELVRQIAEPRLVGKSLGIHPLLTLFASYVGFYLFGILGMLLAPIVAMIGKVLLGRIIFEKDIDKAS
ncbi:MAG: sporulation integral membrane protein YtvI [Clostridia bacterium]|nr:sporulation integral membrane protein YtvI [Clostridia bacterium]